MSKKLINKLLVARLQKREPTEKEYKPEGGDIRIVILQRGWIYVGKYFEQGENCWLENASCVRSWGTTKGLGELAESGPTSSTKLDSCPIVRFNKYSVVCTINCAKLWDKKL